MKSCHIHEYLIMYICLYIIFGGLYYLILNQVLLCTMIVLTELIMFKTCFKFPCSKKNTKVRILYQNPSKPLHSVKKKVSISGSAKIHSYKSPYFVFKIFDFQEMYFWYLFEITCTLIYFVLYFTCL